MPAFPYPGEWPRQGMTVYVYDVGARVGRRWARRDNVHAYLGDFWRGGTRRLLRRKTVRANRRASRGVGVGAAASPARAPLPTHLPRLMLKALATGDILVDGRRRWYAGAVASRRDLLCRVPALCIRTRCSHSKTHNAPYLLHAFRMVLPWRLGVPGCSPQQTSGTLAGLWTVCCATGNRWCELAAAGAGGG